MAYPVTTSGSFTCANGGSPSLTSQARLTVAGQPVLPFSAVGELGTYTKCNYNVSNIVGPCTKTVATSGGPATKLTVAGKPVLLQTIIAPAGNPPPQLPVTVAAGQTRLTAA